LRILSGRDRGVKEIEEQVIKEIKVNEEEINRLRFADDIATLKKRGRPTELTDHN
jgi:hypothetical protein